VIGAERLSAVIAVELIAARAEQFAADFISAGMDGKHGIAAVFVVFHGETVEIGLAFGAGSGSETWSHEKRMTRKAALVKHNIVQNNRPCYSRGDVDSKESARGSPGPQGR